MAISFRCRRETFCLTMVLILYLVLWNIILGYQILFASPLVSVFMNTSPFRFRKVSSAWRHFRLITNWIMMVESTSEISMILLTFTLRVTEADSAPCFAASGRGSGGTSFWYESRTSTW